MLSQDVIKYNIAKYMDFEDLDKIDKDTFWYYAEKNPIGVCDYLCSIHDEERLIECFEKLKVSIREYYKHCWQTSAANVEFMATLCDYLYIPDEVSRDVVIGVINGKYIHTSYDDLINRLLSKIEVSVHDSRTSELFITYIERSLQYDDSHESLSLFANLDRWTRLRIFRDLHDRKIRCISLLEDFAQHEIIELCNKVEDLTREEIRECLKIFIGSNSRECLDLLLELYREEDFRFVSSLRTRYANASDEVFEYLPRPEAPEAKIDLC